MTIDATFWVMVSFFLFIGLLIYFQIPQKIKNALEENISNIKKQIDEANKLKEDAKNILIEHEKKEKIEKEIEKELIQAQKEITELKKNSISDIHNISKEIAANIIENISGDKLNESSIKAAVEEISKKNVGKYL